VNGTEVRRVREALSEAMGREVSQLDLGLMLRLNLASVEVTKWEDEGVRSKGAKERFAINFVPALRRCGRQLRSDRSEDRL